MKNLKLVFKIVMVLIVVLMFACSQQNVSSSSRGEDDEIKNNPNIASLDENPEKDGVLSQKSAAINGFKNAVKFGLVKMVMDEFPNDYMHIKLADMFLVEDNSSTDYFVVVGEKTDGSIAVISSLDAVSGHVLEMMTNTDSTVTDGSGSYVSEKTALKSLSYKSIAQTEVKDIHAEYIREGDVYDRMLHWKWVVALKNDITTKAGKRSVLMVSPSDNTVSSKIKIKVFNTAEEESRYLSNASVSKVNKMKSPNYYKSSANNQAKKEVYETIEIE